MMQLTRLDPTAGLQTLVIFFDQPTQTVPFDHTQGRRRVVNRLAAQQDPLDRILVGGTIDFPDSNHPAANRRCPLMPRIWWKDRHTGRRHLKIGEPSTTTRAAAKVQLLTAKGRKRTGQLLQITL